MKTRAFSLIEVVVGLGLLALILPLALNLVPGSLFAQRRAQTTESATALAQGWLQIARTQASLAAGLYGPETVVVGGGSFGVVREVYNVDAYLQDVVVVVSPSRGQPIRLASRLERR